MKIICPDSVIWKLFYNEDYCETEEEILQMIWGEQSEKIKAACSQPWLPKVKITIFSSDLHNLHHS